MKLRILSSLSLIVAGAAVASANIVTNGSFEVPNNGSGWGLSADDGIVAWYAEHDLMEIGAASVYGVTGQDMNQVLELDANHNAYVSQKLSTSATTYLVTFTAAARHGVASSSLGGHLYWNDTFVGGFNPASTVMTSYSFFVTGTGTDKISFEGAGTDDSLGTLIDNVTVEAVPEPMTMVALAGGALALLRRRKSA